MTARQRGAASRPVTRTVCAPPTGPTAIIVTHNSQVYIGESLTALRAAGIPVRVVDNASTDGTVALIDRDFPEVALIRNESNVGFARAVNQALVGERNEVVLMVNPDCVVADGTVAGLVDYLRRRPEVGVVGPRLVDQDGRVAISAHPFESLASVLLSRFGGSLVPVQIRRLVSGARRRRAYDACRRRTTPVTVDWLSGACLAVRTHLLRSIGGLDERYFLYYEDEELCLQAWRHGSGVVYLPGVQAVHVGGASSAELGATWPHLYRSMLVFFARHRRRTYQAVRVAVLLRALMGMGLAGVRLVTRRGNGASRARAWRAVAWIALTSNRKTVEGQPA
jgi:N-acetylglucosaminyl-diphospho-decaprenol L-rhamnosyltransferase